MKQQITKEQWDELSKEHKLSFILSFPLQDNLPPAESSVGRPNIGQMIEFLGDDLVMVENHRDGFWFVTTKLEEKFSNEKELVDSLWEAVKAKLSTCTDERDKR